MQKQNSTKLILLSFFLLILGFIGHSPAQQAESGARNIFDQGLKQNPDSSTQVQQRSELPDRPALKVEDHTKSKRLDKSIPKLSARRPRTHKSSKQTVALKYSLLMLG